MKKRHKWLWAVTAVLTVGLMACSKTDEPEKPTVDPGTEQEDPENPNTGTGNQENQQEDWEDERPHGFYFDIDSIYMPLTEDGFLMFEDQAFIVIEKKADYYTKDRAKEGVIYGVMHGSSMHLRGKKATPWSNVDKYIELFRNLKIRPDSRFCNFPELADLPVRDISRFGFFTLETLVSVDVVTHKRFNKDIPAGASMRGTGLGINEPGDYRHPVGISYGIADYDFTLDVIQGGSTSFGHDIGRYYLLGRSTHKLLFPGIDLCVHGYPEEAGDYPMTLRMEFANGTVLTKDFKIRFVDEE